MGSGECDVDGFRRADIGQAGGAVLEEDPMRDIGEPLPYDPDCIAPPRDAQDVLLERFPLARMDVHDKTRGKRAGMRTAHERLGAAVVTGHPYVADAVAHDVSVRATGRTGRKEPIGRIHLCAGGEGWAAICGCRPPDGTDVPARVPVESDHPITGRCHLACAAVAHLARRERCAFCGDRHEAAAHLRTHHLPWLHTLWVHSHGRAEARIAPTEMKQPNDEERAPSTMDSPAEFTATRGRFPGILRCAVDHLGPMQGQFRSRAGRACEEDIWQQGSGK